MVDSHRARHPEEDCLFWQSSAVDGYTMIYRIIEGSGKEPDDASVCYHLKIEIAECPKSVPHEAGETVILEDISRSLDRAKAIAALFAKETVMPCTAAEVMEELLSDRAFLDEEPTQEPNK